MNDDELRRLFSDAVSDVEPEDRLDQIRTSVHSDPKVVPMSRTRSWRYAAVGVAATVAVIGGVAYAAGQLPGSNQADDGTPVHPGPSSHQTTSTPTTPVSSPTTSTSSTTTPSSDTKVYAVYYVGTNSSGKPVLFREFHRGAASTSTTDLALAGLGAVPLDPDYVTDWPAGSLVSARWDGNFIDVVLGAGAPHDRPASMSAREARMSVQQVVYSMQAAIQHRAPVQFLHETGKPADRVFGVDVSQPVVNASVRKTLSLMSISNPNEGDQVSGMLTVSGANNGFEATVVVYLERNGKHFLTTPGMASGAYEDRLFPWTVQLDLSKVQPGQYTLVAQNDDPSGQGHPEVDTRTIVVK